MATQVPAFLPPMKPTVGHEDAAPPPPATKKSETHHPPPATTRRAWSLHSEASPLITNLHKRQPSLASAHSPHSPGTLSQGSGFTHYTHQSAVKSLARSFPFYIVYALVNVIISLPGLYGYSAVIFNHPVFSPHMNALSKLVIFSSMIHQLSFLLFSSLPFAIGTVQDAGLIFLSSMAGTIADDMLADGESEHAILSTTLVLLSLGTATLGIILILIGKFKLANVVSYLPMPVVGGYLAFIGYFCIQAGVALCISKPLISFTDWAYLAVPKNLLLAVPGLLAGLLLTWVSRAATNDAYLPLTMVLIPAVFYAVVYATGLGLEGARAGDWVGDVAPPVPISDLFHLVDFSLVRWDLVGDVLWTWVGMVFVVSFASCLDVAAIAMDKGEALDTNRELATVGIGNLMSGLTFGFTGSYIFSQTIFTYRTGVHSRWIGFLIMLVFLYVVVSPINVLQMAPLFFFGSTLIFIGYDLLYEWLIEIRPRVLLSEYGTIWGTFIAIQIVGVDFGIVVGVLVAILDNVVATAQATTVRRVQKRSRAVWTPSEYKVLQEHGYHPRAPKILCIEVAGPVFFGSSLGLLDRLVEEAGLEDHDEPSIDGRLGEMSPSMMRSPHTSSFLLTNERRNSHFHEHKPMSPLSMQIPPQFVVIDLSQVSNMDASAARTCFLQFTAICSKKDMVVCGAAATPRMDWMLRSHGVSYTHEEENEVKSRLQRSSRSRRLRPKYNCDKIILFLTVHEALECCEDAVIHQFAVRRDFPPKEEAIPAGPEELSVSDAFARILDATDDECVALKRLDGLQYHDIIEYNPGDKVFAKGAHSDSFYTVLSGAVASYHGDERTLYRQKQIISGAGLVPTSPASSSNLLDSDFMQGQNSKVATVWPVCGIFGYTDLLLERPRFFGATAAKTHTRLAKLGRSHMNLIAEDPELNALVHRVLLRASVLDLANCTCSDV